MKFSRFFTGIAPVAMTAIVAFAACTPTTTEYTATFDYNYSGAPAAYTVKVKEGDVVTPPSDPTRENYRFDGWYNEKTCKTKADFDYAMTADISYYALWTQTTAIITYNANYTGGTSTTASATIGQTATQPASPTRDGYVFIGWYTEAACTNEFSFTTEITSDMELYAAWEESTGDTVKVTFKNNYGDNATYYETSINTGRRVSKPGEPTREEYAFLGWYTDADCTQAFSFNTLLNTDTTLYAKWNKVHTFEAEYTDMTGKVGTGWSSSVEGRSLIDSDSTGAGASNGFFVGYMYVTGNTLTFYITAEEATTDCVLVLRLTAEGEKGSTVSLTDDELLVTVNGEKVSYDGLYFDDIPDINGGTRRPFSNFTITTSLALQKGENVIELKVNNSKSMGGTMSATAPMFDCLYLYTNTNVDWTEGKSHPENLDGLK
jgi:uncharacterized repeat protein (TIGR02543 family)